MSYWINNYWTSGFWVSGFWVGDDVAPVLSLPTGVKTGPYTGSGTVTTDQGNGILYFYASVNATETAATIKASGDSQAVVASGVQNVSFQGLVPSTAYFAHYVHDNAETNESNVVNSSPAFTTDAAPPATSDSYISDLTSSLTKSLTGNIESFVPVVIRKIMLFLYKEVGYVIK